MIKILIEVFMTKEELTKEILIQYSKKKKVPIKKEFKYTNLVLKSSKF